MQIRDVFAVARKHRWIVLAVFVLTVGLAAGFAFTKPKKYEGSATIAMFPNTAKGQGFVASDNLSAILDTCAETAKSSVTRARAAARLGHPVRGPIETETTAGTGILTMIGRADTPEEAYVEPPPRLPRAVRDRKSSAGAAARRAYRWFMPSP